MRELFCCQSGKRVDEVFDNDLLSHCDAGQIDRSIPDLKLFEIDHELFHLIGVELNSDLIRAFLKSRGERGDLFHVEQLRECACQVKGNVMWSDRI